LGDHQRTLDRHAPTWVARRDCYNANVDLVILEMDHARADHLLFHVRLRTQGRQFDVQNPDKVQAANQGADARSRGRRLLRGRVQRRTCLLEAQDQAISRRRRAVEAAWDPVARLGERESAAMASGSLCGSIKATASALSPVFLEALHVPLVAGKPAPDGFRFLRGLSGETCPARDRAGSA